MSDLGVKAKRDGQCIIVFKPSGKIIEVEQGTLLLDAARRAGVEVITPCGGFGRCGRCKVQVEMGEVARRQSAHLTQAEIDKGSALACMTVVKGDAIVYVEPKEKVKLAPPLETAAEKIALPIACEWQRNPRIRKYYLEVEPPTLADATNDLDRLRRELKLQHGVEKVSVSLPVVKNLATALRQDGWKVTTALEYDGDDQQARLIGVLSGDRSSTSWGVAVDIGTTTVVVYLVDLLTSKVVDAATAYNGQINAGDDVISRIIYSQRGDGLAQLQGMVVKTINDLLIELGGRNRVKLPEINEMVVAGNTTMTHLFLGINAKYIREEPYVPVTTHPPVVRAAELGVRINHEAGVYAFPSVGSYVGGDIVAGVLSSAMFQTDKLTLFIDVGTNGEIVLGSADWLMTCACSAGPAFEGAGVRDGMRAIPGAIEEIWINTESFEPTYRVMGNLPPQGICGSGLLSALAELFVSGVIDKGGRIRRELGTPRVRVGEHGAEYVVAWASETQDEHDIVLTEADINNLIRAKAAIYAGFSVLVNSVGLTMADVEQIYIAGGFGRHINIEKAIQIGLLPDMPWDRFKYLGNTSALGAYTALVCQDMRSVADEIAAKMTYLELSADNSFMNEYTSALFLPHTDMTAFPTVADLLENTREKLVLTRGSSVV
ncbi:MAG: DUF4445 domain-containing protein [Chloroflexi bacterium]|nr:DUF4445 domain-containing protein [Chloroflexota bacterium]